jgi:DNA-binding SARP family transcriptional activator/tetratricopeptide (TPR) repeat protein
MIMDLRVLGPVELWSAGRQHNLGPAKLRCVLAILLLTPRTIVPAESLVSRLWDETRPPKARQDLSAYVSRLRNRLRQIPEDRISLVSRAHGYMLDVDPEAVDLHRFRRLRRQAAAITGSGDSEHAVALLREAEALWRGQALAGLPGDYVTRVRHSLEEERRAAIAERIELELRLGRHAELVGELHDLAAQYPLDEALVGHQMTALYRSGRPSDALEAYRDTRSRMITELGTEPGPVLAGLHQRILSRDPGLDATPSFQRPRPDTLPPCSADFVGRTAEIRMLSSEQDSAPLIWSIEGMPGAGKTALAVHAARGVGDRYPDGSLYLNLHGNDPGHAPLDPADALDQMLRMMSVLGPRIPRSTQERAALWQSELARRRAVIVLDDASGPAQVQPLLPAEGHCLTLVTARRHLLGLDHVRPLDLDVLPAHDAVALFSRIAGPDRTQDQDAVAQAVQMCGYLPLAIQLTAARLRRDNPPALSALVDELAACPGSAGAASAQVISAFDVSYRGLADDQQRFFCCLATSPCTEVSVYAAAALSGATPARAEAFLNALLDHHLLARTASGHLRFHDLIRGFAADRARTDDLPQERRQAVRRLLDYYLHTADRADRVLCPHRRRRPVTVTRPPAAPAVDTQHDAAKWMEAEWRSVLQAAQYAAEHEWLRECADLAHVIAGFLDTSAYWDDAAAAHSLALQACRDLEDPPRIAQALLDLCLASRQTGHHEATIPQAQEAAAIYRTLADRSGEAAALDRLGMAQYCSAQFREALAYFQEARILYTTTEDRYGVAATLSHAGIACWYLGRYPEAISSFEAELAINRELDDLRGEARTLNNLADIQRHQGYHRDALQNYQRALAIFQNIGGRWNLAILHSNIGNVHRYKGSYEEALAEHRKALAIYRATGDLRHQGGSLHDIGTAYHGLDNYGEALTHHQKALSIAGQINDTYVQVIARRGMADAHRGSGRHDRALDHYRAALRLAREIGDLYEEAQILRGIAESVIRTKGPGEARIALRQSLDIFQRLGTPEAEAVRNRIYALGQDVAASPSGPWPRSSSSSSAAAGDSPS